MQLSDTIGIIEGCNTVEELRNKLQGIVQNYGFANYSFLDIGHPGLDNPYALNTIDKSWDDEYRANGFVHVDPMLSVARRTNTPFHWGAVPPPARTGKRKSGAIRIMEAAQDHGLNEGFIVPFHFIDQIGRLNSALCVLFWKDKREDFLKVHKILRYELHVVLLYWAQRLIELAPRELGSRQKFDAEHNREAASRLTDRERAVMEWAARGKTMGETATILAISDDTVESHLRNAMRKLGSINKTQAVVQAIKLGYIDI